jgi:hypothetical protein
VNGILRGVLWVALLLCLVITMYPIFLDVAPLVGLVSGAVAMVIDTILRRSISRRESHAVS